MMQPGILSVLDIAAQITDAGIGYARRAQLLREAKELYSTATDGRIRNRELLLALEKRLDGLNNDAQQRLLIAVHAILRDQVAFDNECLEMLEGRRR